MALFFANPNRKENGITYLNNQGEYAAGGAIPSAWDYTKGLYDDLGLNLNYTDGLINGESEYAQWDQGEVRDNLNLDEREGFAEDMFNLFDLYKPQMEHIAENAGVSGAELSSNLANSGARYNANYDAMTEEANRDLRRMGVNPNSGRYAAMTTGNALGKAAGYSANQNQVRQASKAQDMNERLQAAQIGLNVGGQGANMYGQMGAQMQGAKQFYDQMGEQSRQFNTNAAMQSDQMKLAAHGQMTNEAMNRHNQGLQVEDNGWRGKSYSYGF